MVVNCTLIDILRILVCCCNTRQPNYKVSVYKNKFMCEMELFMFKLSIYMLIFEQFGNVQYEIISMIIRWGKRKSVHYVLNSHYSNEHIGAVVAVIVW